MLGLAHFHSIEFLFRSKKNTLLGKVMILAGGSIEKPPIGGFNQD
ncbi:hypothetical protein Maynard_2 [Salmonella phage Maynard]|uniref:Uncharacterized protein n=11 Tax=Kuttervirus TaxID=2169536 RepID=A0A1W5PUL3_9CAUD|nr:hypothetical protein Maynard_2 [Salmonella phage Maynard]YP_009030413.1 hypothetical protein FF15_gp091 [Salmonella phage vB-SalM-SJ3]YP_009221006.1 hypothetical protein SP38_262 [Salmonella phage 38]YP_009283818.1 hypothetical protein BI169_gp167 [Salmonella phage GG32]YP_009293403.1 hypothetical protein BI092_gp176 [Salmonella phage vB-SalM-PM10]YP_009876039.1 hypothetical protein HYP05_gp178 [Salmonella phage ST-W77]YP_009876426.1 hypothetical protein HYP09_gp038 [Salmonella phage BSP10